MYDLIGDIHGHADELMDLLERLGYEQTEGCYGHPDRQVIFVGDFIDRGPKIREVLHLVRAMIDNETALAVMGNHEFNAIAFRTNNPREPGTFLRRHEEKNVHQHSETLKQLNDRELAEFVDWFRTLPPWLELDGLRVVHACWDRQSIEVCRDAASRFGSFTDAFMHQACYRSTELFEAVEDVLKGKEVPLPNGVTMRDKDGFSRTNIRVQWYRSPHGETYRNFALPSRPEIPDVPIPETFYEKIDPYPQSDIPVFCGHYWLSENTPSLLADNVCCLDYSVAKGGFLCAYRWDGERQLSNDRFVRVGPLN